MMEKGKEIHFYVIPLGSQNLCSWHTTEVAIANGKPIIHTYQMGLLSTRLFELGYRVFVHEDIDDAYEIKLGTGNERTDREIKMGHNLFKMWQAGEFSQKG